VPSCFGNFDSALIPVWPILEGPRRRSSSGLSRRGQDVMRRPSASPLVPAPSFRSRRERMLLRCGSTKIASYA